MTRRKRGRSCATRNGSGTPFAREVCPLRRCRARKNVPLLALVLVACAARPVLYPHHSGRGGTTDPEAQRAIEQCLELAKRDVGPGSNEELTRDTVEGGVVGGATGAAVGAVTGSVGRGAAAGAAGGATHGLVRGLFTRNAPDPVTRAYVERCLRERDYDVIGWR